VQLSGRKVIVTGAGRGMGKHFAERLLEAGAQVAAGDVDEKSLAELPERIHKRKLDVSKQDEVRSFVDWASDTMGGLDVLVNNAGIIRDGLLVKKDKKTGEIKRLPLSDFQAVIDVNLTGATMMAQEFAAKVLEKEWRPGVIVNISSISRHGNRGQSSYVAAKAAIASNTLTWARELAPFGVRVVGVAPGMIETPMTQGMNQAARDALVAAIPVGRIGLPEDIWLAVKFAIECDYANGRTYDVDGGHSM